MIDILRLTDRLAPYYAFILCSIFIEKYRKFTNLKFDFCYYLGTIITVFLLVKTPVTSYIHLPYSPSATRFFANQMYKSVSGIFGENDKVYIIYDVDETNGLVFYVTKYLLNPIPTNNFGWKITEEDNLYREQYARISPSQWLELLNDQKYTYVYVVTSQYSFWDSYGELFDTYSEKITHDGYITPQLFKVTPNGLINVPITVKFYE